jgi:hypothetical protein
MRYLLFLAAMLPTVAPAAECSVTSGPNTAALVELYTSEGCSSCPPADRWLSTFVNAPGTRRVVPIAFHVSYWDYIGWKDVYADPRYTDRQREIAKASGARMVYTPQVMVGGRDYRDWGSERSFAEQVDAINRVAAKAQIQLSPRLQTDGSVVIAARATLTPNTRPENIALLVALTQNAISSRVTAGENRGENLSHNFVVRDLKAFSRPEKATEPALGGSGTFRPKRDWNLERMSAVAFVQNLKTGEILQALSAPLCRG